MYFKLTFTQMNKKKPTKRKKKKRDWKNKKLKVLKLHGKERKVILFEIIIKQDPGKKKPIEL
jgi:hypothetical protein